MEMGSFLGNGLGFLLSSGGGCMVGCLETRASIRLFSVRASSDLKEKEKKKEKEKEEKEKEKEKEEKEKEKKMEGRRMFLQ